MGRLYSNSQGVLLKDMILKGFRNNVKAALRQADDVACKAKRVGGEIEYTVSNAKIA